MRTFKLNKLVRDGIVQGHIDEGGSVDYFILPKKDRLKALANKLVEESQEFSEEISMKELAQIYGLLISITDEINMELGDLEKIENEAVKKLGAYKKGHFVNTVTVPDNNWLAEYYSKEPKRFPEAKD